MEKRKENKLIHNSLFISIVSGCSSSGLSLLLEQYGQRSFGRQASRAVIIIEGSIFFSKLGMIHIYFDKTVLNFGEEILLL